LLNCVAKPVLKSGKDIAERTLAGWSCNVNQTKSRASKLDKEIRHNQRKRYTQLWWIQKRRKAINE